MDNEKRLRKILISIKEKEQPSRHLTSDDLYELDLLAQQLDEAGVIVPQVPQINDILYVPFPHLGIAEVRITDVNHTLEAIETDTELAEFKLPYHLRVEDYGKTYFSNKEMAEMVSKEFEEWSRPNYEFN